MEPLQEAWEFNSRQSMVKPILAKIAEASGLTPMSAWVSISVQTITFLVCEAMLCPERAEHASAITAPKYTVFIAWLTSTATGGTEPGNRPSP